MNRRLTALVPAHNDDYTLDLCLASLVDHFDEIVVLDDCSDDLTAEVALDYARRHRHVRLVRHEGRQGLGWIESRNRLAAATDSDWLFFIDADDVLCEYNAHLLKQIAEGPQPVVRLCLTELWGDFHHTTGRLAHYDRCHTFVDRGRLSGLVWRGGAAAKPWAGPDYVAGRSPGPLFFHIKGVKPDRRLVERQFTRAWLRAGRPGRLQDFAGLDRMSPEQLHARAVRMLLESKTDSIRPFDASMRERCPWPEAIARAVAAGTERFQMLYADARDEKPCDRADRGWVPASADGPWETAMATCELCGWRWVAVAPFDTQEPLECPRCGRPAGCRGKEARDG